MTNQGQSNMTDPNIPQDKFYLQKVDSATAFTSYYDTDYLQIMALSTRIILEKVQNIEAGTLTDTFSVMYTPMDTGNFSLAG